MSWEAFWGPNLLQATLFAGISAVVGTAVGLIARRWFRQFAAQVFGEQQRTTTAAVDAANKAGVAAVHATSASEQARTAGDNSRQASQSVLWLADQLGTALDAQDRMARRNDNMLNSNLRLRALLRQYGITIPPDLVTDEPSPGVADDTLTVAGRHRFRTQITPTLGADPQGDHE